MKQRILQIILILLLASNCFYVQAQQLQLNLQPGQTYTSAMMRSTQQLPESRIPYSVLYDRVVGWAELTLWQSGDTTDFSHIKQAWWDLENSMDTSANRFETMKQQVEQELIQNRIPLVAINFGFGYVDSLAVQDGRMRIENGKLIDASGASPYLAKRVHLAALGIDNVLADVPYNIVSGNIFTLENLQDETITGYTIQNMNNGQSFTLQPGGAVNAVFSTPGNNTLNITMNTSQGSYSAKQIINVLPFENNTLGLRAAASNSTEPEHRLLTSTIPFQAYNESSATISYADYHIYYHFLNGNTRESERILKKPIIILDGFDPEDQRNYAEIYDSLLLYDGSIKLADQLRKKGYDVVILNFPITGTKKEESGKTDIAIPLINGLRRDGGTDYIERNAFLLVKLIQDLNDELRINGSNQKLIIVGPSMGGQISRYALAYMEKKEAEGVASMKHNTKLWVSFDSPHEGANIPLSLQRLLAFLGLDAGQQEAKDKYVNSLYSPAARQMLIGQLKIAKGSGVTAGRYYYLGFEEQKQSYLHQKFYTDLKSNGVAGSEGWPQKLKKVAIINGAGNGVKTGVENQKVFDVTGYRHTLLLGSILGVDFTCRFVPNYGTHSPDFFYGNIKTRMIGGRVTSGADYTNNNSLGSMDVVPGGLFNTQKEVRKGLEPKFQEKKLTVTWNSFKKDHSFIPAISALGFKNSNFDWSQPINNRNLVQTGEIYFDDYFAPTTNEEHITLTAANVAWLNTWLEKVKDDTLSASECHIPWNSLKLKGFPSICSEPVTYIIENLPECAKVQWSTHSNLLIINQNYNSITVKRSSPDQIITDGWIKAEIRHPKTIESKILQLSDIIIWKPGITQTESLISGNLQSWGGEVSLPYEFINYGSKDLKWSTSNNWQPTMQNNVFTQFEGERFSGKVYISVDFNNPCGEQTSIFRIFQIEDNPYGYYTILTDTSSGEIKIFANKELKGVDKSKPNNKDLEFDQIVILDAQRNIKYKKSFYKSTSYLIDTNQIPNGIYTIQILSEGKVIEEKLIRINLSSG